MSLIGGILIGLIIGGAIFFGLLVTGNLNQFINIPQGNMGLGTPTAPEDAVTKDYVESQFINKKIDVDENLKLYREYKELINSLQLSRDYEAELNNCKNEYSLEISQLKLNKDNEKKVSRTNRLNTITILDKELNNSLNERLRKKSEADKIWSNKCSERERARAAARSEFDKKLAEIEREHELNRQILYKTKTDADAEYSRYQQTYQTDKSKCIAFESELNSKADIKYENEKSVADKKYKLNNDKIKTDMKQEILSKLNDEQKVKFKAFI